MITDSQPLLFSSVWNTQENLEGKYYLCAKKLWTFLEICTDMAQGAFEYA